MQEEKEVIRVRFFPLISSFLVTAASTPPRAGTLEIDPVPTEGEEKLQKRRRVVAHEAVGKEPASDSCLALWPTPLPPSVHHLLSSCMMPPHAPSPSQVSTN